MSTYQRYLGRFVIDANSKNFSLGAADITLTEGYYYLHGYSGETNPQLCEHMQDAIRTEGTYGSATVTLSLSTGLITIATGGSAAAITWTDTNLQTYLGFSGTQSSATSHVAGSISPFAWYPSLSPSMYPLDLSTVWAPDSTTRIIRSPDGTLFANVGDLLYAAEINYDLLSESEVVKASRVGGTLEHMFENVFHNGWLVRIYPDRDNNTSSSDFVTGMFGNPNEEMLGTFAENKATRRIAKFNGLWDCSLPFMKNV